MKLVLNLILMGLFYIGMLAFIGLAAFGKRPAPEETNLMLWAIWCLMMVNSRRNP